MLSSANRGVGTGITAFTVVGGRETESGREDGIGSLFEERDETVTVDGDVGDRLTADDERRVVAIRSGMLDEEQ